MRSCSRPTARARNRPRARSTSASTAGTSPAFDRKAKCVMNAYAVEDGKLLWSAPCSENYNAPVDIFVLGDIVYVGKAFTGYDLKTGEEMRKLDWSGPAVAMAHPRCHRYKATVKNLFTGRSGIEVASFESGWLGNNSWIRGTCQFGIMPANGLLYKAPDACGCYPKTKVQGFFAAAPRRDEPPPRQPGHPAPIGWKKARHSPTSSSLEVPSVRQIPLARLPRAMPRAAAARTRLSAQPRNSSGTPSSAAPSPRRSPMARRSTSPPPTPTPSMPCPAKDGKIAWTYTAGGSIDSAPTLHGGLLFFGSGGRLGLRPARRRRRTRLALPRRARPTGACSPSTNSNPSGRSTAPCSSRTAASTSPPAAPAISTTASPSTNSNPLTGQVLASHVVRTIDPDTDQPTVTEPRGDSTCRAPRWTCSAATANSSS